MNAKGNIEHAETHPLNAGIEQSAGEESEKKD